ncbi:hypothetical protein D3C73_1431460 [compost metagenome]
MAVGDDLRFNMPLFVQEQVEMLTFIIDDMFDHRVNQLGQLHPQLLGFPYPV